MLPNQLFLNCKSYGLSQLSTHRVWIFASIIDITNLKCNGFKLFLLTHLTFISHHFWIAFPSICLKPKPSVLPYCRYSKCLHIFISVFPKRCWIAWTQFWKVGMWNRSLVVSAGLLVWVIGFLTYRQLCAQRRVCMTTESDLNQAIVL